MIRNLYTKITHAALKRNQKGVHTDSNSRNAQTAALSQIGNSAIQTKGEGKQ